MHPSMHMPFGRVQSRSVIRGMHRGARAHLPSARSLEVHLGHVPGCLEACIKERVPSRQANCMPRSTHITDTCAPPKRVQPRCAARGMCQRACAWTSRSTHRGACTFQTSTSHAHKHTYPLPARASQACITQDFTLGACRGTHLLAPRSMHRGACTS